MPLEIRGAHFLIRSAQLERKTRLELALHISVTLLLGRIARMQCKHAAC